MESRIIQPPFVPLPVNTAPTEEEVEQKKKMRAEQGNRLRQMGEQEWKKMEQEKQDQLEKFVRIKSLQESNPREYKKQLKQNKLTEEQLNKKILELDPTAKIAEVKDDKEAFNLLENSWFS